MRAESEVRAARDAYREMVAQIRDVHGDAVPREASGVAVALYVLEWVTDGDRAATDWFARRLARTEDALRQLRDADRAAAERN